jgi:16S rRNA U1498 N3-methylase RsmE
MFVGFLQRRGITVAKSRHIIEVLRLKINDSIIIFSGGDM